MTRRVRDIVGAALAVLAMLAVLAVAVASAAAAPGPQASDPYKEALDYRYDKPRIALAAIEAEIRSAKPEQLRAIEVRLLAILKSPAATRECKDWVCRQLRQAGSEASAEALGPLLADKELAAVARLALQGIPAVKVDGVLSYALGTLQGDLKAGVIQSLGARRTAQAVPLLVPLLSDPEVAEAALFALGQIGGDEALRGLLAAKVPERLRRARFHALVLCAERKAAEGAIAEAAKVYRDIYKQSPDPAIKAAALRGILLTGRGKAVPVLLAALRGENAPLRAAAAKFVCAVGGSEVVGPILAELPTLPAEVQVMILGTIEDQAALTAVLAAAKSGDPRIRVAALDALGRLGDASNVTLLLGVAAGEKGDAQEAARRGLRHLRGPQVDPDLIAAARAGEPGLRREAMAALASRGSATAVSSLLAIAEDPDPVVHAEALAALAVLGDVHAVGPMARLVADAKTEARRNAAQRALAAVCQRIDQKDAAAAALLDAMTRTVDARRPLLAVLARTPCARSLAALREAAGSEDAAVKDTAIRGLADWPDPAAMSDLAGIARTSASQVHKVLALRGVVRLAALPSDRPADQTVKLLGEALALAGRAEEKTMVLAALADVAHPAALELAGKCLSDKDLEVEAATAVVKIAKKVQKSNPDAAAAAIRKVLAVCTSPAARQVAESTMVVLGSMVNIAPQGTATSPDGLDKDGAAGDDQAAIDGDPATYWDEQDDQKLYRLVVTFEQPEKIAALRVTGYEHHSYAPKDFEILCDGKVVQKVENAQYGDNQLVIRLKELTCTTVELKITGCYGRSPAIRELGIYRPGPGK